MNWSRSNKEVTALSIPQTSCHLSLVCPVLSRVKSYTNEEKCEQWHQLRLAYNTDILQGYLMKNGGQIRDWNYASYVGCLPSGLQDWEKTWDPFLESPGNFSSPENWFVFIQDQSFNNFKNNKMKLSVIEGKLAGSWARNSATIQQVWILKFAFRIEKFKFRGFR